MKNEGKRQDQMKKLAKLNSMKDAAYEAASQAFSAGSRSLQKSAYKIVDEIQEQIEGVGKEIENISDRLLD